MPDEKDMFKVVCPPLHKMGLKLTDENCGLDKIDTEADAVAVQPLTSVPVVVYVVAVIGIAVTLEPVAELSDEAGVQE